MEKRIFVFFIDGDFLGRVYNLRFLRLGFESILGFLILGLKILSSKALSKIPKIKSTNKITNLTRKPPHPITNWESDSSLITNWGSGRIVYTIKSFKPVDQENIKKQCHANTILDSQYPIEMGWFSSWLCRRGLPVGYVKGEDSRSGYTRDWL